MDAEILVWIQTRQKQESSGVAGWALLVVSAALFLSAGWFRWNLEFVLLLGIAVFIHELGHLAAMRVFQYKNLKMLFIPLLGGLAMGSHDESNARKIALIALAGPLVGLVSVWLGLGCWLVFRSDFLIQYTFIALSLNLFNLLPLVPLDGGRFLSEIVFSRYPKAQFVFKILTILGLGVLAFTLKSWVLGIIAFVIFVGLQVTYRIASVGALLRSRPDLCGGELTEDKVGIIRDSIVREVPPYGQAKNKKGLFAAVANTWVTINKIFPGAWATVLLVLSYLGTIIILGPVTFFVIILATHGDEPWAPRVGRSGSPSVHGDLPVESSPPPPR